jgi:Periplasmic binding protein
MPNEPDGHGPASGARKHALHLRCIGNLEILVHTPGERTELPNRKSRGPLGEIAMTPKRTRLIPHAADCLPSPRTRRTSSAQCSGIISVAAGLLLAFAAPGTVKAAEPLRLGLILDMSGPYADVTGPGSAAAAQMAVEDFGGQVLGKPVTVISADHRMALQRRRRSRIAARTPARRRLASPFRSAPSPR